ncbi:5-formyltetrahydrofolate cyclo-ligase [Actinobacillus genomosp. 1]|uniref:5-formyltetrahydrofolate cyclo-ligase n=1 Tax=Actinobacillus genomosp. 1 TaxID=254839 RepID=UPI002441C752|nr:5-formyltetrahydrofolate cyclo-ligase [Actinobacillus genomosp. 1]WGE91473.1 5-formyltetrahydrofolate cyclo-ligase [Actinobacillus genomosp. 1]
MQAHSIQDRHQLRQFILAERAKLSLEQQSIASLNIIPQALSLIDKYHAEHIALYLPFNCEISPLPLLKQLQRQNKFLYLPILHPFVKGHLLFQQYDKETAFTTHKFGMQQPKLDVRKVKPLNEIEMIFTPLLACDKTGNRLGYGGGFYDRTLALATEAISVGLAYPFQFIEKLPTERWDIPLNHLILGDTK